MVEPEDGGSISVRVIWVDLDETPVYAVNHFIGQVDQDEITLSLGYVNRPVIVGDTAEERKEQVESLGFVAVRPVSRVVLTRRRLLELLENLNQTLAIYDTLHSDGGPL